MNPIHERSILDLLRSNSMTPDVLDLSTMTQLFLSQMRVSLYGGNSSIPMLPTFLKPFGTLTDGEPVAVAEVDDQEIRVCLVAFAGGQGTCTEENSFPVPGREYPAPFDDLIYAIAELLEPLLPSAQRIALSLPFPIDYDGKGDGIIRRFPGNMTVSDYENRPVLAALAEELSSRDLSLLPAVLVSEADAVLLAAALSVPQQSRYLGCTWGATIDTGFSAPGSIVLRWLGIPGDLMLFHGGFSSAECVPFGMVDFSKDRDSYGPGRDLYLKMVSTDYLGEIYRLVMIKAAEKKLLSFGCSRDILSLTHLSTGALADFLETPEGTGTIAHYCRETEDRAVTLIVANAVIDRAARLVCANLSAVLQFTGAGRSPEAPACLGLWGQALQIPPLRTRLEGYLDTFTKETLGLHTTCCTGEHMLALGSAAAALYNRAPDNKEKGNRSL